jgi:hypothetical protein
MGEVDEMIQEYSKAQEQAAVFREQCEVFADTMHRVADTVHAGWCTDLEYSQRRTESGGTEVVFTIRHD